MKKIQLGLAASATLFLLAACGGANEPAASGETAEGAAETAQADSEVAAATPEAGDVSTLDGTALADFTGDAANGEKAFVQCQACHVVDPGVNRMGPSLAGVVGRAAGGVEGFQYSASASASAIVWTPEKLNQFLENPRRAIPGTRMAFGGVKDGQERADIIAYLQAH